MLAGAAFAADITGAYQLDITAFSFNTQSKDFAVVKMPAKNSDSNGKIRITTSDEKSGATLKVMGNDVGDLDGSIWFKPVDALKLSLSVGDIAAEATFGDLTLKGSVGKTVLDQTYTEPSWNASVGYAIPDVATVSVIGGYDKVMKRNNSNGDYTSIPGYAVAAEVSTSAIPMTSLSARVGYYNTEKDLDLTATATETINDIAIEEHVEAEGSLNKKGATVPAYVKVTLPVSDYSLALKLASNDTTEIKDAKATASATLSGTYGVISWTAGLKLEASPADGATISVPVTAKVSF